MVKHAIVTCKKDPYIFDAQKGINDIFSPTQKSVQLVKVCQHCRLFRRKHLEQNIYKKHSLNQEYAFFYYDYSITSHARVRQNCSSRLIFLSV